MTSLNEIHEAIVAANERLMATLSSTEASTSSFGNKKTDPGSSTVVSLTVVCRLRDREYPLITLFT